MTQRKTAAPAAMLDLFDAADLEVEPVTPSTTSTPEGEGASPSGHERAPWVDEDGNARPGVEIKVVLPPRAVVDELDAATRGELAEAVGPSLAVREVRSFAAALFPELGPTTLRLAFGVPYDRSLLFVVTSSRHEYTRAREAGTPAFVMSDLVAFALAAQNHRMPPPELARVLDRKRHSPAWILSPEVAFGGMPLCNAAPLSCTLGDAFDLMGARLVGVEVHT